MARKPRKSPPSGGKAAKAAAEQAEQAERARSGAAAEERRLLHEAAWSRMFGKIGGQNPFAR